MAKSSFPTVQHPSTHFVESCGAVLFDLSVRSTPKICLINHLASTHWMLPKGRRNVNESRKDAAVREVTEETGYACHLLPVKMSTRACASDDPSDVPDEAKVRDDITEPFMCSVRDLGGVKGAKFIWWYVAVVTAEGEKGKGEDEFTAEWFEVHEAVEKLWFETDREVLNMAISIVKDTLG